MLSNPIYYPYPAPKHIKNWDFRTFDIDRIFYCYFLQALISKDILYQM